jgi:hypothetical protein
MYLNNIKPCHKKNPHFYVQTLETFVVYLEGIREPRVVTMLTQFVWELQNTLRSVDLLADSHNILNRWKNYFSQLLNVHRVSDVRQMEIHTAEPLVPDPSPFEVGIAIVKLKRSMLSGSLVTTAWRVLRLRMEETPSSFGG